MPSRPIAQPKRDVGAPDLDVGQAATIQLLEVLTHCEEPTDWHVSSEGGGEVDEQRKERAGAHDKEHDIGEGDAGDIEGSE